MIHCLDDKENTKPNLIGSFYRSSNQELIKCSAPPVKSLERSEKKSCFSRLWKEARDEVQYEGDETTAIQIAMKDARFITKQWKMEEEDKNFAIETAMTEANIISEQWRLEEEGFVLAKKISDELEEEAKLQMERDETLGEMIALRIAIEEKRKREYEENVKKELLEKDFLFAEQLLAQERELLRQQDSAAKENISSDELLARRFAEEEKASVEQKYGSQEKSLAEDCSLAKEYQDLIDQEEMSSMAKLEESDREAAEKLQMREERSEKNAKYCLNKTDARLARRLMRQSKREEHRRTKRLSLKLPEAAYSDLEAIGDLWRGAEAEVENVEGGICLSVLLPHLRDVRVRVVREQHVVEVEARRMVLRSDVHATEDSSTYLAEFQLEGVSTLEEAQVSYDYSSESGMLHVYVDNLQLGTMMMRNSSTALQVLRSISKSIHRLLA